MSGRVARLHSSAVREMTSLNGMLGACSVFGEEEGDSAGENFLRV